MQNKSLNFMHFVEILGGWMLWSVVVFRIKRQHKGLHKGVKMEVPTIFKVFYSKLLRCNESISSFTSLIFTFFWWVVASYPGPVLLAGRILISQNFVVEIFKVKKSRLLISLTV